jgi:hypothetical protein
MTDKELNSTFENFWKAHLKTVEDLKDLKVEFPTEWTAKAAWSLQQIKIDFLKDQLSKLTALDDVRKNVIKTEFKADNEKREALDSAANEIEALQKVLTDGPFGTKKEYDA